MKQRESKLNIIVNVAILAILVVLLFSPNGMVGRWIASVHDDRKKRREIAEVWTELTEVDSRLGSGDDARTIVEFVDYECPACRRVSQAVSEAAASQGVTVVLRHFPLAQIHPAARSAGLAAICAERYGVFAEVHNLMMTDDGWMANQDWADLATEIGIAGDAFEACTRGSDALQRLRKDRELGDLLAVQGTPTFITRKGTFFGQDGWMQALATLPSSGREAANRSPTAFDVLGDTIFDSAMHPDLAVSNLGTLSNAMFLSGDRLLIQDGVWFHFVDYQTGDVVTVGGGGEGPGEFRLPFQAVRSADGVVVWDLGLGRLTFFSASGDYRNSRKLDPLEALRSPMAPMVAAFSDGSVVFRDDSISVITGAEPPSGVYREPARYIAFSRDGSSRMILKARGSEVVYQKPLRVPIIFGHSVLEFRLGNGLVIAQTDLPTIGFYDGKGNLVQELPMPGSIDVSRSQIASARETAIRKEQERASRLGRRLGQSLEDNLLSNSVPVNDPAPPIDGMFADLDGRLWLRRYRLPGDSVVRWQAWGIEDASVKLVLRVRPEESLRDVIGDNVLLHVEDALGVDRVLVQRIASDEPGKMD